jgi:SAM-dependent methyltransferase
VSEPGAAGFWEDLYAEREHIWSGEPNAGLVATAAGLAPGLALDLGCGEGGDTVWLARQGWRVTAVDIAATAITRARTAAEARGLAGDEITWVVADLATWEPPAAYDLVSACFLQSPVEFPRRDVLRRAAAAVADGGHLLVVSHAAPPPWARSHGDHERHFPTPAEDLADLDLDPSDWEVLVNEVRQRDATGPDGERATLDDTVTFVRRR